MQVAHLLYCNTPTESQTWEQRLFYLPPCENPSNVSSIGPGSTPQLNMSFHVPPHTTAYPHMSFHVPPCITACPYMSFHVPPRITACPYMSFHVPPRITAYPHMIFHVPHCFYSISLGKGQLLRQEGAKIRKPKADSLNGKTPALAQSK